MISFPDRDSSKLNRFCDTSNWVKAKKRYQEAASDLKFQFALSPFEIFPAVADLIVATRKTKAPMKLLFLLKNSFKPKYPIAP